MEAKDRTSSLLLTQSGKRPISCVSAISPPLSPTKRTCYDLDDQKSDTPEIFQPIPRHVKSPTASLLEALVTPVAPDLSFNEHLQPDVLAHVTGWLDGVFPSSDTYQERRPESCRDIWRPLDHVRHQVSKTAPPTMGSGRKHPPTPSCSRVTPSKNPLSLVSASSVRTGTTAPSTGTRLVEECSYRYTHLAENHINLRDFDDELPENVRNLFEALEKHRGSPSPLTTRPVQRMMLKRIVGDASEDHVIDYFDKAIVSNLPHEYLFNRNRDPFMLQALVPSFSSEYRVSQPKPNMLYGYDLVADFSPRQLQQLVNMHDPLRATNAGLHCPYLVIEFKGDGPSSKAAGGFWVAANQCLGAAATCVNLVELFNDRLSKHGGMRRIEGACFSIAMNNKMAELYISWKDDEDVFQMQQVAEFILRRHEEFDRFRTCVRNVIAWGMGERLGSIKRALDDLADREGPAGGPTARASPSGSSAPSVKRPKMSDA